VQGIVFIRGVDTHLGLEVAITHTHDDAVVEEDCRRVLAGLSSSGCGVTDGVVLFNGDDGEDGRIGGLQRKAMARDTHAVLARGTLRA
jgi:hypothetical protein